MAGSDTWRHLNGCGLGGRAEQRQASGTKRNVQRPEIVAFRTVEPQRNGHCRRGGRQCVPYDARSVGRISPYGKGLRRWLGKQVDFGPAEWQSADRYGVRARRDAGVRRGARVLERVPDAGAARVHVKCLRHKTRHLTHDADASQKSANSPQAPRHVCNCVACATWVIAAWAKRCTVSSPNAAAAVAPTSVSGLYLRV
eukprot:scaffold75408_cov65-Phaeocystis_antarctica.AAC.2